MPNTSSLEEAIRDSGEGWLIDMYVPPAGAIPNLLSTLNRVGSIASTRLGANAPSFTEASIV